jgi:transposase InsO family protein
MRREWLTALIKDVHDESRGTYGSRRVHAELTKGRGVWVSERLVAVLMQKAGIAGLPGPAKVKRIKGIPTADDLVQRKFARSEIDELWVTDITEHPTREGKVSCCSRTQHATTKDPGMEDTSGGLRRALTIASASGCCFHRLNLVSSRRGPSPNESETPDSCPPLVPPYIRSIVALTG